MVTRAYNLGKLSEATYRRAYVHLNKTGERTQERDEPPTEPTTQLVKALAAATPEGLAATLGVGMGGLRGLVNQRSSSADAFLRAARQGRFARLRPSTGKSHEGRARDASINQRARPALHDVVAQRAPLVER